MLAIGANNKPWPSLKMAKIVNPWMGNTSSVKNVRPLIGTKYPESHGFLAFVIEPAKMLHEKSFSHERQYFKSTKTSA